MTERNVWLERRSKIEKKTIRHPYDHDYARILHSSHFRRLQGKTQVYLPTRSDFIRTRLTHSLEVAQVALGICDKLKHLIAEKPAIVVNCSIDNVKISSHFTKEQRESFDKITLDFALINAISIAHDLGHPPFGHSGEEALNKVMFDYGGFEGNAQTLRIISKIATYSEDFGLDLCRRTLLGVIKYPAYLKDTAMSKAEIKAQEIKQYPDTKNIYSPSKGIYSEDSDVFEWVLEPLSESDKKKFMTIVEDENSSLYHFSKKKTIYKSFDCSLMELADDIAYGVHDLEDAIKLGLINKYQLYDELNTSKLTCHVDEIFNRFILHDAPKDTHFVEILFNTKERHLHKRAIGELVNYMISSIQIVDIAGFEEPLLRFNCMIDGDPRKILNALKRLVSKHVIASQQIYLERYVGMNMIRKLAKAFIDEPSLVPEQFHYFDSDTKKGDLHRGVCDYIAGMSNSYITNLIEILKI